MDTKSPRLAYPTRTLLVVSSLASFPSSKTLSQAPRKVRRDMYNGDASLLVREMVTVGPNCLSNDVLSRAKGEEGIKGSRTFLTKASSTLLKSCRDSCVPVSCFHTNEARSSDIIICVRIAMPISRPTNSKSSRCCTERFEGWGIYRSLSSPIRCKLLGVGINKPTGNESSGDLGSCNSLEISEKKARYGPAWPSTCSPSNMTLSATCGAVPLGCAGLSRLGVISLSWL
mmetsp:Transcript_28511/g.45405  ORF Transcript_28511/g.45405 Transcript_28511/m.45405 type:complete len:229 (-) Transcript_28511:8134-8820(-)